MSKELPPNWICDICNTIITAELVGDTPEMYGITFYKSLIICPAPECRNLFRQKYVAYEQDQKLAEETAFKTDILSR